MLSELLQNHRVVLASNSPRRQQFLQDLAIDFEIRIKSVEEVYPPDLVKEEITNYLAKLKAEPFLNKIGEHEILITSDTIVWHLGKALGKPRNADEAVAMLTSLSGKTHEVISSVCVTTAQTQRVVYAITEVTFKELTPKEIGYYVNTYKPFDKAGSYGIQEWIGAIGIVSIRGSYNNVVGLPTFQLYELLQEIIS